MNGKKWEVVRSRKEILREAAELWHTHSASEIARFLKEDHRPLELIAHLKTQLMAEDEIEDFRRWVDGSSGDSFRASVGRYLRASPKGGHAAQPIPVAAADPLSLCPVAAEGASGCYLPLYLRNLETVPLFSVRVFVDGKETDFIPRVSANKIVEAKTLGAVGENRDSYITLVAGDRKTERKWEAQVQRESVEAKHMVELRYQLRGRSVVSVLEMWHSVGGGWGRWVREGSALDSIPTVNPRVVEPEGGWSEGVMCRSQ